MEFEWDENKKNQNMAKHGISFSIAKEFFEGKTVRKIDNRKNYSEERLIAFGEFTGRILAVVYTIRDNDIYRIISIRRASKNEQRTYYTLQKGHEG